MPTVSQTAAASTTMSRPATAEAKVEEQEQTSDAETGSACSNSDPTSSGEGFVLVDEDGCAHGADVEIDIDITSKCSGPREADSMGVISCSDGFASSDEDADENHAEIQDRFVRAFASAALCQQTVWCFQLCVSTLVRFMKGRG